MTRALQFQPHVRKAAILYRLHCNRSPGTSTIHTASFIRNLTPTRPSSSIRIWLSSRVAGWVPTTSSSGISSIGLKNDIQQTYSEPDVQLFVGGAAYGTAYSPLTPTGQGTSTTAGTCSTVFDPANCIGQFGYATVSDFGTDRNVTSFNHGLFAQDSWTIGHGVTLNAGIRFDKEYLPASTTGWADQQSH